MTMANKLGCITVSIFAVFLLYAGTNGRETWRPSIDSPYLILTRHYWFKPNTESFVQWRNGCWLIRQRSRQWERLIFDEGDVGETPLPGVP